MVEVEVGGPSGGEVEDEATEETEGAAGGGWHNNPTLGGDA